MPYQRDDCAVWWVSYRLPNGQRVRRSTGTKDRKEAEALEHKWKMEAHWYKHWDVQPSRSFDELLLGYLRETQTQKRSAERDRYSARQLRKLFGGMQLAEITPETIVRYKRQRTEDGVKDSTIARELRLLSAAINYARREWGWDIPNQVQGRCPKELPGRLRWLTRQEAEGLIKAATTVSQTVCLVEFIQLGFSTGMRTGEMLKLEWSRVDLGQRLIYLEPEDQKNKTRGSVPINETARNVFMVRFQFRQQHCPDSPWVFCDKSGRRVQSVKRSFRTACSKAGIKDFRPHDMRHTCAAWLVQDGVPIRTVCELLRHKDIRTTMRYAHLAPENVRNAVAVLDWSRFGHGHCEAGLSSQLSD